MMGNEGLAVVFVRFSGRKLMPNLPIPAEIPVFLAQELRFQFVHLRFAAIAVHFIQSGHPVSLAQGPSLVGLRFFMLGLCKRPAPC